MGFFSKLFKGAKKVVKGVTGAIKKVGKGIAKVAKKVVKGVGKALGKLGPLAGMAMMFIPGMQAFASGIWSSIGITGQVAQTALTSAATTFVASGGNLKAAVIGGAVGGLGAVAGGTYSGMKSGMSFGDALSNTMNAQSSITSFSQGLAQAKVEWGNFTSGVEDFFSSQSATGDVATGTENYMNTFDKYGMSPAEYKDIYGKMPDTVLSADQATLDKFTSGQITQQEAELMYKTGDVSEQLKTIVEQNAEFGELPNSIMAQQTPVELAANSTFGGPDYLAGLDDQTRGQWADAMAKSGIDINSEQAKMLAEQQFGGTLEKGTFSPTFDADLAMTDPTEIALTRQSAMNQPTTEGWIEKASKAASSLLSPSTATASSPYSTITDPGSGDPMLSAGVRSAGIGGGVAFTDVMQQYQANLLAQIKAQQERYRQLAAQSYGIA